MEMTTTGARVTRLVHDGAIYIPIVRAGAVLGPEELHELATTTTPAPPRSFNAIVADESHPQPWEECGPMDLADFKPPVSLPLTYADYEFVIGRVESLVVLPAGCVDDTEGRVLIGVGRMNDHALAAIVWPAIQSGLLRGLCAHVVGEEPDGRRGRMLVRSISHVNLGLLANNGLVNARIVDSWEGEQRP